MDFLETEQGQNYINEAIALYKERLPIPVGRSTFIDPHDIDDKKRKMKGYGFVGSKDELTRAAITRYLKMFELVIEKHLEESNKLIEGDLWT